MVGFGKVGMVYSIDEMTLETGRATGVAGIDWLAKHLGLEFSCSDGDRWIRRSSLQEFPQGIPWFT